MKRTSTSSIPKPSSTSTRQSLGPLRVRDENRNSGIGATGTRARSSFGQGRLSFGQSRVSVGRPGVKRPGGASSSTGTTPGKSRRSSGYRGGKAGQTTEDPRNVRSRTFQKEAINKLLEFLVENGYVHPINQKMLASPQTKDFIRVFEFLMGFLEPNYKIIGKMEEEVPRVMKSYFYPFSITKSSMFAVGSPLAWPAILGALDWLREVIQKNLGEDIEDIIFSRSDEDFDAPIPKEKLLWNYVIATYEQYMDGEDTFEELEAELAKQLRTTGASGQLERLAEESRRLKEMLEVLETQPDRLTELRSTIADLNVDLEKLRAYNSELENHAKKVTAKRTGLDQELEMLTARLNAVTREAEEKRHIYETQEYSRADVERINRNKQTLIGQKDLLGKENADLDQQIWEKEIQITKEQEKCNQRCSEYHRIAHMNKLVPASAENTFGLDVELKKTTHWHNADIFTDVKPMLLELKKRWKENNHEMNEQITTMREAFEQIDDMLVEKKDTVAKLETKLSRLDKDVLTKKEESAREITQLEEQLEKSREACERSLRDMKRQEGRLDEARRRLAETKFMSLEEERKRQEENKMSKRAIVGAIEAVVEHKSQMQKKASELNSMTRDLACKERDKLIKEGAVLPWEQPGYTGGRIPQVLPRWVEGVGLAIPVKSGWHPVQAGVPLMHFAQLGTQNGAQSSTGTDTESIQIDINETQSEVTRSEHHSTFNQTHNHSMGANMSTHT